MAFSIYRFTRVSLADNTGARTGVLNPSAVSVTFNGPAFFTYASADDAIATIAGANYFTSQAFNLQVGDVIMCVGSDASLFLQVATVDTSVSPATITTVSFTPAGLVATANIDNLAVTTAKIDNLAVTAAKLAADAVTTAKILDGNVTSAKLADNLLHYVAVPITAAAFNGAYAAPKLLLAAAGANTLIVPVQCQLLMTYGSAAFANGGVTALQWDSTANGAGVIASTTLSAATFFASASTGFNFNAGVVPETFTTCVNKGIYLSNVTGAFINGTGSAFVAHLWYRIIPTV